MANKPSVGFIGLGIMGLPMAGHILKAGYPLTVYNRTRSKTRSLEAEGAAVAASPREVAENSRMIITMVSDSPDVQEVVAGAEGVLDGIRPGSVVMDMSTISPQVERDLDRQLREKGCTLVDAPVSGGDVGAQNATLAIMAGGEWEAFDRAVPIFETMGKTITYCGPVGSGQLTKLCNQILVAVTLMGVSEALVFAGKNGLDQRVMIEAVKGGAAGSWQLSNLAPRGRGPRLRAGVYGGPHPEGPAAGDGERCRRSGRASRDNAGEPVVPHLPGQRRGSGGDPGSGQGPGAIGGIVAALIRAAVEAAPYADTTGPSSEGTRPGDDR